MADPLTSPSKRAHPAVRAYLNDWISVEEMEAWLDREPFGRTPLVSDAATFATHPDRLRALGGHPELAFMTTQSELNALRDFLGEDRDRWSDSRMDLAIMQAREWIGGRRWSWKVVAANVLRDGYPHA